MKCPQCDFENEEGSKFCSNCNIPLNEPKAFDIKENPHTKIKKEKPETMLNYLVNKIDDTATKFHEFREPCERGNKKGTKQLLGLIGSAVLFVGVFAPIISVPIMGNMNYFQNRRGDGIIVLVLVAVSLILILLKKFKGLWFTGLSSMAILAFTFINFQIKMSDVKTQMEIELTGNPFRGIADMAIQSVQLQWGWALLIIGVSLVIASAAIKDKS